MIVDKMINKYTLNAIVMGCNINLSNSGLRCLGAFLGALKIVLSSWIRFVFIVI